MMSKDLTSIIMSDMQEFCLALRATSEEHFLMDKFNSAGFMQN